MVSHKISSNVDLKVAYAEKSKYLNMPWSPMKLITLESVFKRFSNLGFTANSF